MPWKWSAALLLLSLPVAGQDSKTLDLSTGSGRRTHFVVFASRGGSATGHAFVGWGIEDAENHRSTIRALGLYPETSSDNCSSVVRTVPGRVMDEMLNHSVQSITQKLIVRVDEADYQRSWKLARAWDCKNEFSLFSRDCVQFLRAVGDALHLPMPRRNITRWTPQAYVRALLASVSDGKLELPNGVYEGSLMDNQPMGHGTLTYPDHSEINATFWGLEHLIGTGRLNGIEGGYRYEGGIVDYRADGAGTLWRIRNAWGFEHADPVISGAFANGRLRNAPARSDFPQIVKCGQASICVEASKYSATTKSR